MKKTINILLALMLVVSCIGYASAETTADFGDVANDPAVTLVYAEVNPLDSIVGKTGSAFKEKVEELSGGSISIDIQASGVLGDEGTVLDSMLGGEGIIDIARISAFALTSYGCEKATLLSLPYTFTSRAHYWNFANSELAKEFLMEPVELNLGVRGLFYGEEGFRNFFTTAPVASIEDMNNLKLRVSNDPVMTGMVMGLGASPTVVAYNELYTALQTGVVDGAEQPIANYSSMAFYEVAPNMILDGHTLGAIEVIISEDTWNSLTENQQNVITAASEYAKEFCANLSESQENEVIEALVANGVNIVEVEDKSAWVDACSDVISAYTEGNEEMYQQIVDMK